MNEIHRRLRGKIRQKRSENFSIIDKAVDYTTELFIKYFENKETFLSRIQKDPFRVLILSTIKDLPLSLKNSQNTLDLYPTQIVSIDIVAQNVPSQMNLDSRVAILDENQFLTNKRISSTLKSFGDRSNWIKQQYLKMKYVADSDLPVLILDSDTFLKQHIFLFDDHFHTLLIGAVDFHYPYTLHARHFYHRTQPLMNFVNHVQIQMPNLYSHIFPGDFDSDWIQWANLGKIYGEDSPISEFQTYAGAVLGQESFAPILVSLDHDTIDLTNLSLGDFENAFNNYGGNLLTAGNKLLSSD